MRPVFPFLATILCLLISGCMTTGSSAGYFESARPAADFLAKRLSANYRGNKNAAVAVVPPINQEGGVSRLGRDIAESLQAKLFERTKFRLIERTRIESLLKEVEFSQSSLVSGNSISEFGKLSGADNIVTGSLAAGNAYIQCSLRIVEVETGIVLSAAEAHIFRTGEIYTRYLKAR